MKNNFDKAASDYDTIFSNSLIGQIQRNRVWNYLNENLPERPLTILELNGGTGIDATYFAKKGHKVMYSDISEGMIETAKSKISSSNVTQSITLRKIDINKIDLQSFDEKFDLVFSNFGGLNCLSPSQLKRFSLILPSLLKKKGHFISVVMPKFNIIESVYFALRLKLNNIFRRNKGPLEVKLGDTKIKTWYYSPQNYKAIFKENFHHINTRAIGFLPSYFAQKVHSSHILVKTDALLYKTGQLSSCADHFLSHFELRSKND